MRCRRPTSWREHANSYHGRSSHRHAGHRRRRRTRAHAGLGGDDAGTPVATRLEHLKADLAGLVSDGTLTYAQADKVAATLTSERPRGRGHSGGPAGLRHDHRLRAEEAAAAAKALGLSRRALRAEVRSGKSLAQIADARHVSVTTLVNDLVAVAKTRLGAALRSGRLTQTQAVRIAAHLPTRITRRVDRIPQARAAQGSRPAKGAR